MASRRSRAREMALQMLYQQDLTRRPGRYGARMIVDRLRDEDCRVLHGSLFAGVMESPPALDAKSKRARDELGSQPHGPTDRNVLRPGSFRAPLHPTPSQSAIDEALELAKRYGTAQSSQFVNGILDKPESRRRPENRSRHLPSKAQDLSRLIDPDYSP